MWYGSHVYIIYVFIGILPLVNEDNASDNQLMIELLTKHQLIRQELNAVVTL